MKSVVYFFEGKVSAVWMMAGNLSYALSQAALIAIMSKFLGLEAVGIFSYALAITAPIVVLANMGLRTQVATDTGGHLSLQSACYFRNVTSVFAVAICLSLTAVLQDDYRVLVPVLLIALSKAFESQADLSYGVLSKLELHKKIACSLVARSVFGLVASTGAVFLTGDIDYVLGAYAFAWMIAVFVFDKPPVKKAILMQGGEGTSFKSFVVSGLPLGISTFIINLSANAPKFMLEHQAGLAMLGVYSALFFIVQSGGIAVNSIGQAFLPRMALHYSKSNIHEHYKLVAQALFVVVVIGLIGAVGSYALGSRLVPIVFGHEFEEYSHLLWLMFALSPAQYACSLFGYVVSSMRRNYGLLSIQVVNLLVSVAVSYMLIVKFGVYGAVYSIPVSSAVVFIVYFSVYLHSIRRSFKR